MADQRFSLPPEEEARIRSLFEETVVIDGLLPSTVYVDDPAYTDALAESHITVGHLTVAHKHSFTEAVSLVQAVRSAVEDDPGKRLVLEGADIATAHERDQTGIIIGFQGARPIEASIEYLDAYYQMGVRILQLTYNSQNYLGSGCWERDDAGLTHFGRRVIDRMNDLGMLIDLSHCNDRTTREAIEYSTDPVAFTHVGVRDIGHAYGRGKTDEQLERIAAADGLIGVTFHPPFVKKDPETHQVIPATLDDVLDHIDHIVDLVGPAHVSFGSDMNNRSYDTDAHMADFDDYHMQLRDQSPHVFSSSSVDEYVPVDGLDRTHEFDNLAVGLADRGYSDDEIAGIVGGTFARVFENVVG